MGRFSVRKGRMIDLYHNIRAMHRREDCCAMFAAGAVIYTGAELLWRGHSHWTMTLTGGACSLMIHLANRRMRDKSIWLRALVGCGIITCSELAVGCVVNRALHWNVWDYSAQPLNIMGQICPLYCVMWYLLSIPAFGISSWVESNREDETLIFV